MALLLQPSLFLISKGKKAKTAARSRLRVADRHAQPYGYDRCVEEVEAIR